MKKPNMYFNPSRLWLLLKLEIFQSRKGLLLTIVITFGLLFFLGFLIVPVAEYSKVYDSHSGAYAFALLTGGFILSSLAFHGLRNTLSRIQYLTLPVSSLERFICMWLLTSVGWIILFTLTFTLYTWIANPIGQLLFRDVTFRAFDPFGKTAWHAIRYYFVIQGIFLAGAAFSRGYVLPKTLFILILFSMACMFIAWFFMRDLTYPDIDDIMSVEPNPLTDRPVFKFWLLFQWLFWWVLPPLSWILTYLGLKDQEV